MSELADKNALPEAVVRKLEELHRRHREVEQRLSDPEVFSKPELYRALAKEHGFLAKTVLPYRQWLALQEELVSTRAMLTGESDPEMRQMTEDELADLEARSAELAGRIQDRFLTEDAETGRNVIMEIRAGTGGDEAALFAADLFGMYRRFAESKGWKVEVMEASPTDLGGFKEIILSFQGEDAYRFLRYESGGHRVQRVPFTETSGRIHTSAATVAVLPEPEPVEVQIKDSDLQIERVRSGGPGGQSVNKTASAVRIHHLATGIIVLCQVNKSQFKNLEQAMRILRTKLYEMKLNEERAKREAMRRSQIGSGDRSQRIRTYNFPQDRLTDHRINESFHGLERIMQGNLDDVVAKLLSRDRAERLAAL